MLIQHEKYTVQYLLILTGFFLVFAAGILVGLRQQNPEGEETVQRYDDMILEFSTTDDFNGTYQTLRQPDSPYVFWDEMTNTPAGISDGVDE